MNFFRSEEHIRRWEGFNEKKMGGVIALGDLMQLFSGPYFKRRLDPDWVSHMSEYMAEMLASLDTLEHAGDYWRMSRFEKLVFSLAMKLGLV